MTGITSLGRELSAKRLQLLNEAFPKVTHVGLLHESNQSGVSAQVKEFMDAAAINGIRISPIDLKQAADFDAAFRQGPSLGVHAYVLTHSVLTINNAKAIADRVFQSRLPAIFPYDMFVKVGGLMSYAPSLIDNFRRAAGYVDRTLKGSHPGDLPIQQPLTYELTVNMQTSKALRYKIPQSILVRADKVME